MTISKGDKLPDVTLVKATAEGPQKVQSGDYFKGKKVALFSVPGAFTPTCSAKHLPGFVDKAGRAQGQGRRRDRRHRGQRRLRDGRVEQGRRFGRHHHAGRRQRRFRRGAGPDDGRLGLRHGQARPALLDGRRRRRRRPSSTSRRRATSRSRARSTCSASSEADRRNQAKRAPAAALFFCPVWPASMSAIDPVADVPDWRLRSLQVHHPELYKQEGIGEVNRAKQGTERFSSLWPLLPSLP